MIDYVDSCTEVFNHFGVENQRRKLLEETLEFLDEVLLYEKGIGDITKVYEELGDIKLILDQFQYVYDIKPVELIESKNKKLRRTIERIDNGYYEGSDK